MAQRRMFSLQIVDTDAFLDMPQGSQLLYFQLAMRGDDDGFVDNPKKIMRMIGSNDDDMKILLTKRFILSFESGIIVIKHWGIHNYIQSDRYHETKYLKEKAQIQLNKNGSYTECIQDVSKMDTEVRLGKVRLGKKEVEQALPPPLEKDTITQYSKDFIEFWEAYPVKKGKKYALACWKKAKDKPDIEKLLEIIEKQKDFVQWKKGYTPNPATWLNQGRWDDEEQETEGEEFKIPAYHQQ